MAIPFFMGFFMLNFKNPFKKLNFYERGKAKKTV